MANLSKETNNKIDSLVNRVAKKSGYASKEISFEKYVNEYKNNKRNNGNSDFKEEIKTYLSDSIIDLMNEGLTESEALEKTINQFDEAELMPEMEDFMKEFNDFGIKMDAEWFAKHEAIGVFYGGFIILGTAFGTFGGYLAGGVVNVLVGTALGLASGVGLGLISQVVITAKGLKK